MTEGKRANRHGQAAEDSIAAILQSFTVRFDRQVRLGRTIYNSDLHVDFVLRSLPDFPDGLALESKWQDGSGTIDEKFPYVVETLRFGCPIPAIVIVHGGGCKPGAFAWLRQQCGDQPIAALRLEEFVSWLLRGASRASLARFNHAV